MNDITESNHSALQQRVDLPEAKTAQILGIVAIVLVFCTCCYGGFISAIIGFFAMSKANNAIAAYNASPEAYTEKSMNQAKSAKTLGLIGGILGVLALLYFVFAIIFGFANAIADMPNM
ncbi:MAG: CCC motif membrane protein [Flavobacteriales bacterium]